MDFVKVTSVETRFPRYFPRVHYNIVVSTLKREFNAFRRYEKRKIFIHMHVYIYVLFIYIFPTRIVELNVHLSMPHCVFTGRVNPRAGEIRARWILLRGEL